MLPSWRKKNSQSRSQKPSSLCWAAFGKPTRPGACPALKMKKKSRVGNRDTNGLMRGGAYPPEARSWSGTPPHHVWWTGARPWRQFSLSVMGEGRLPVIGGILSGWLISCQGNQQRDTPLTASLITYYQLGPGAFI